MTKRIFAIFCVSLIFYQSIQGKKNTKKFLLETHDNDHKATYNKSGNYFFSSKLSLALFLESSADYYSIPANIRGKDELLADYIWSDFFEFPLYLISLLIIVLCIVAIGNLFGHLKGRYF